ncbi:uncharacterized protein LOC127009873 [Eriocheir sinensis]|uniref:uncharacterized protein LOC127009873 n=1 Tax=Eriocheir sinensis TaxID=95602 RepID=UPI0021C9045E|nr:uncharacterized protein LOC127009873 [Eriocheir sinensis]
MKGLSGVPVFVWAWVWVGVTCETEDPTWMTSVTPGKGEVEGAWLEGGDGGAMCADLQQREEGGGGGVAAGAAVCLRVNIKKSSPLATLLTLTRPSPSPALVVDVGHLGLWLSTARQGQNAPHVSFFEARLPPGTWRHLCVQQRGSGPASADASHPQPEAEHHGLRCFVDGQEEELVPVTPSPGPEDRCRGDVASCPGRAPLQNAAPTSGGVWQLCVGGGHRSVAGAVADVRVWAGVLDDEALRAASLCPGRMPPAPPPLHDSGGWVPQGNASTAAFPLRQVCAAAPRLVDVRPAGTFRGLSELCVALGGAVPPAATLKATLPALNESCEGPAGLLSWVDGDPVVGAAAEETCPAVDVGGGAVRAACVLQLPCSVCVVPRTSIYRLYGHDGSLFDFTFYLETEADGQPAFRGSGGSRLERAGDGWRLASVLHSRRWKLAEAAVLPLGRRRWTEGGVQTLLALTVCRSGQFSCDDGQCVAQTARCNDIVDCRDRSDEAECIVVVTPEGYDPYYPPPPRPGETPPLDLPYHIDVYYLSDVTTEEGRAGMDVGVTLSWYDSRLRFLNLKPDIKNYFPCKLVWTPVVRAVAGRGIGFILDTDDYEKFCYTYASNERVARPLSDPLMGHLAEGRTHAVEVYLGVLAWLPCRFRLPAYPFDAQRCNMSFVMTNAPGTRAFTKASPGRRVPYLNSRRVLLEYELHALTTEVGAFLQGTDNNTYFALTFHLRRLYGYHVTNSYFPSLLMFVISWATFFFQIEDFTNRIMIALTAQLVLAALFTSTNESSVKTPYLKLIDVWYAAIITFCFVIVISQTVINVILHHDPSSPSSSSSVFSIFFSFSSSSSKLRFSHRLTKVQPLFTRPKFDTRSDNTDGDNNPFHDVNRGVEVTSSYGTPLGSSPSALTLKFKGMTSPPAGLDAATRWNSVIRVCVLGVACVFVCFYVLVCGGVFQVPGNYNMEDV